MNVFFSFLLVFLGLVNVKAAYDKPVDFACPASKVLSYIGSVHSNPHEDRIFFFNCRTSPLAISNHYKTGYLNWFDEKFSYVCPPGFVVTGMSSIHHNSYEDRRYKLTCSQISALYGKTEKCQWTAQTAYDAVWSVNAPDSYIRGMKSEHHNGYEDRRFSFYKCKYQ